MSRCARLLHLALACAPAGLAACGGDCDNVPVDVGALCLPDAVTTDRETLIEVRESCGLFCANPPDCNAVLREGTLVLELREDQCPSLSLSCFSQQCARRIVRCSLPRLAAGDYPVVVPGSASRLLRARDRGGASACRLPVPGGG